jgi:predicted phosphodiesterase
MLQLTDLHLGKHPSNALDERTFSGVKQIVEKTSPDLLLFTGDIVYSMEEHGAPNPREMFENFIEWVNALEIPYAVTFGNHDSEDNITREELREIYEQKAALKPEKKHIFLMDERENYVLELKSANSEEVQQAFFIIDSGDYSDTLHSYYAWVLPEQVRWFRETAKQYKKKDSIKRHLVFQHIPIPEYWWASQNILDGAFNESIEMNLSWTEDETKEETSDFPFKKGVFSPEVNSGLFLQMLLNEETWGMFVGHDHDNSFHGIYKDIHLVYGQSSGYNSYGDEPKGGRMIALDENKKTIETYPVYYEEQLEE